MKIAVLANTGWYVYNFRRTLIERLVGDGYKVYVIAPEDRFFGEIARLGAKPISISMTRTGVNVFRELKAIFQIRQALSVHGITLVLSYTPKGNLYTAFATLGTNVRQFANVSGLGRVFSSKGAVHYLVSFMYRVVFGRVERVFFQNREDMRHFLDMGFVGAERAVHVPGSGVNLTRFCRTRPMPSRSGDRMVFLMVSRLIVEKGVKEYVEAARIVKARYPDVEFRLLGAIEHGRHAITPGMIELWVKEGTIKYLGESDDVKGILEDVDCVVLPSYYREGVPRSLLEAASMELPIVTTDTNGCRDALRDGETGFLCEALSAEDLAKKLIQLIEMAQSKRRMMGKKGRARMESEFDENIVLEQYLAEIRGLQRRMKGEVKLAPT